MALSSLPSAEDVRVVISTSLTDDQIDDLVAELAIEGSAVYECLNALSSDALQKAILRWLAAHFINTIKTAGGGAIVSDKLGDASRSYHAGGLGKELRSSAYGQRALELDPNGCLARIGKPKASIEKV